MSRGGEGGLVEEEEEGEPVRIWVMALPKSVDSWSGLWMISVGFLFLRWALLAGWEK